MDKSVVSRKNAEWEVSIAIYTILKKSDNL